MDGARGRGRSEEGGAKRRGREGGKEGKMKGGGEGRERRKGRREGEREGGIGRGGLERANKV